MVDAYPLQYPTHWSRTEHTQRSRFDTAFGYARDRLLDEIRLLGGTNVVISSNIELRQDGLPYANRREPDDVGIAVYFTLWNKQQCDKWDRTKDNLWAIKKTIEALRGIERWGAKEMVKASFRGFEALPEKVEVNQYQYFIGINTLDEAKVRRKVLIKKLHPDYGGSSGEFAEMQRQFSMFEKEVD